MHLKIEFELESRSLQSHRWKKESKYICEYSYVLLSSTFRIVTSPNTSTRKSGPVKARRQQLDTPIFPAMFIELPAFLSSYSFGRLVSILAATLYGLGPTLPRPPRTHARSRPILSFCTHTRRTSARNRLELANLRSASERRETVVCNAKMNSHLIR